MNIVYHFTTYVRGRDESLELLRSLSSQNLITGGYISKGVGVFEHKSFERIVRKVHFEVSFISMSENTPLIFDIVKEICKKGYLGITCHKSEVVDEKFSQKIEAMNGVTN
jgi:hypothetical protein